MKLFAIILVLSSASVPLAAGEGSAAKRLRMASKVFQEILAAPDKTLPTPLLDRAECIIVVPGVKKAAIGIGGEFGRGFVSCRRHGTWGGPPQFAWKEVAWGSNWV